MSKRKRDSDFMLEADDEQSASSDRRQQDRHFESVLERSKQSLSQALKLARGFERQKLGRRQKAANAAKEDGDMGRFAAEVAALKSLNIYSLAETYLFKSTLKMTSVASAPTLPSWIRLKLDELYKPQDIAHANVQARLFNSQPVKKAMNESMGYIRSSLGLGDVQVNKRKRTRKADYLQQSVGNNNGDTREIHEDVPQLDIESSLEKPSMVNAPIDGTDQTSASEENVDYPDYHTRLGGSSDESFDRVSESGEFRPKTSNGIPRTLSVSPSSTSSESGMPLTHKLLSRKESNQSTKVTTFLPSLTAGGYWSGSEPASDDDGALDQSQRKNRRGQRERRLIAEKKHGQNANHLKKQARGQDRDQGWHIRRGAEAQTTRGDRVKGRYGKNRGLQGPRPMTKGPASSSGANSDPIGPRRLMAKVKPVDEPLHPSWQAAKTAKEQKKVTVFQGKKAVFSTNQHCASGGKTPRTMASSLPSTYEQPVRIAIIGGTGLSSLPSPPFTPVATLPPPSTPWGLPSSPISILSYKPPAGSKEHSQGSIAIAFLARHGLHHSLAPHEIPNQANIAALRKLGVRCVIAFSAVGSLKEEVKPRDFVVVDQVIDWTRGVRPWTFFEGGMVGHVGFADPFDPALCRVVSNAIGRPGFLEGEKAQLHPKGTVICIEGPQFSTRAESVFYRNGLNASVINMSAIPEAKLAREAEMAYSMVCMSTDYDSWHETNETVSVEMVMGHMMANSINARKAVEAIISELGKEENEAIVLAEHWNGMTKGAGGITKVEGRSPTAFEKLNWLFPNYFDEGTLAYTATTAAAEKKLGNGKHLQETKNSDYSSSGVMLQVISLAIYGPTMFLVKLTLFLLFLHIFGRLRWFRYLIWHGIVITGCFYVSEFVIAFALCTPPRGRTWLEMSSVPKCSQLQTYGIAQGIMNLVSDLYLLVIPIPAVLSLQLPKSKKIGVIAIFMTGFLACAVSAVSLGMRITYDHSFDITWNLVIFYIMTWV
ncbi:MAG: hypothetical protein Q9219_000373 [cf. Caloplaca sp. 3 TL-2023]